MEPHLKGILVEPNQRFYEAQSVGKVVSLLSFEVICCFRTLQDDHGDHGITIPSLLTTGLDYSKMTISTQNTRKGLVNQRRRRRSSEEKTIWKTTARQVYIIRLIAQILPRLTSNDFDGCRITQLDNVLLLSKISNIFDSHLALKNKDFFQREIYM